MAQGNGKLVKFLLDGKEVEARPGETIWQVAKRQGIDIPHLCYSPEPGYRADGNCRACMVEIEGERVLAASCIRKPAEGMKVKAASDRAGAVFELRSVGGGDLGKLLDTHSHRRDMDHFRICRFIRAVLGTECGRICRDDLVDQSICAVDRKNIMTPNRRVQP